MRRSERVIVWNNWPHNRHALLPIVHRRPDCHGLAVFSPRDTFGRVRMNQRSRREKPFARLPTLFSASR